MIHPLAWIAWLSAILGLVSLTRNPWYLLLLWAWLILINGAVRPTDRIVRVPVSPLRLGMMIVILSALFNALTVHFGSTVLLRLPKLLPVVGGAITLEALVFGLLNGLILAAIFVAFAIVTRALPVRTLIQLIPRAFFPVAVVASIAVTFVPVTLRQFQQIREAQAIRGHRLRGLRDWLPLLLPLLTGGLERALQLAEAMTARGFATASTSAHEAKTQGAMVGGLSLLLTGWLLRLAWGQAVWGLTFLLLGAGLIVGTLWRVSRRTPHTVYRPTPWTGSDWGVVLGAGIVATAFLVPWPWLDRGSIFYYPYPSLSLPGFNVGLGLATLGLLAPVWPLLLQLSGLRFAINSRVLRSRHDLAYTTDDEKATG